MEEVYVVKVRSKPCASRLFPSERRYSATTVGGLGAIHLLLALTCLLLGSLHILALPGPAPGHGACLGLGAAALLAGLVGLLAWRRWYVDNNILWFFICSGIAGLAAVACIALTVATLVESQENLNRLHTVGPPAPSTNTTAVRPQDLVEDRAIERHSNSTDNWSGDRVVDVEEDAVAGSPDPANDTTTSSHRQHGGHDLSRSEVRGVVAINIIVASTLELLWSLLSAKIAWKGMRNPYPDEGEESGAESPGEEKKKQQQVMKQQKEAMEEKPDIICNHKRRTAPKVEIRRDSRVSHEPMPRYAQDDGPCLPPMERTMDFQEKIHRFLESNREHCLNMNARDM